MCEYIVLEDFRTDKYIYDKNNGLWYELRELKKPIDFLGNYTIIIVSFI